MVIRSLHGVRFAVLPALVILLMTPSFAIAGGQSEAPAGHLEAGAHNSAGDHAEIPHVDPVSLEPGEELRIVATTNIIGDVLRNVVGDAAEITVLITEGQNPHGYTPNPRAVAAIERAHLVFVNGFGLEENLLDTVETTATGYVVPVSAGITALGGDDHDHGADDPHVWFDPNNVMVWTENIAEVMGDVLPGQKAAFSEAADAYTDTLRELDTDIRRRVTALPEHRRKLVIDHASLDYFAEEYGFEVIGTVIAAGTDQAEPSARAVSQLVEVIRRENVPAVFVGATAGRGLQNLVNAVAEEVGREITVGTLLTGSLTAAGDGGESYFSYMEYNVTQIVENLTD